MNIRLGRLVGGLLLSGFGVAMMGCSSGISSNPTVDSSGNIITGASRTMPERMIDFGVQRNIVNGLDNIEGVTSDNVRVAATSFRGDVLLTGEVPNEQIKQAIGNMALSIREVKELYNYLQVSDVPKSPSHTTQEKYVQSKIRTRLLRSSLKTAQYKTVVRSDIVYVMGEMTKEQQDEIISVIRDTDGVKGVVLANKILTTSAVASSYGSQPNSVSTEDDTAMYPASTNYSTGNETYGGTTAANDTGYPDSMYSSGGQANGYGDATNTPAAAPANAPTQNSGGSSGYVQLYQGTNNP